VESELLVETLSLVILRLVKIDNLPSLTCIVVEVGKTSFLSFFISVLVYPEAVSSALFIVAEVFFLIVEYLPPSAVGTPDLHVHGSSRVLDVP
jgi:hypothetical protein